MRISTKTRYGTRLMVELGIRFGEGPIFLKDIAKTEEISEKYLSQIIIPLKSAGLVDSFRGAHGGHVLSRPPEQITMKQVIEALEGNFNLVGCVKNPKICQRVAVCVTRDLWCRLGEHIASMLEDITLDKLVKQYRDKKQRAASYII